MPLQSVEDQMLEQILAKITRATDDLATSVAIRISDLETYIRDVANRSSDMTAELSLQLAQEGNSIRSFIQRRFILIMSQFDDAIAAIAEDTDVTNSAITLMEQLAARIEATAGDPAAVAQLATDIRANTSRMAAAVVANTPAEG